MRALVLLAASACGAPQPAASAAPAPPAACPPQPSAAAPPSPPGCTEELHKATVKTPPQRPIYTAEAAAHHVTGSVVVTLTLSASGDVTGAKFERLLGAGLDENVLASARTMRFSPATRCGVPVPSEFTLKMRFAR